MSKEAKILSAVLVVVVGGMIGLFMLANTGANTPAPVGDKTKIIRDSSHKTGTGAVEFVEFGDFQCPACGAAEPGVERLLREYNGKITFYFRNFPLPQHQNAQAAAAAAEAAGYQDKYWQMHDKLYAGQKSWENQADPSATYANYAKEIGLDIAKYNQALADKKYQTIIDQDLADATALNVNSTPTFYFNGVKYSGQSTYEALKAQIDSLLTK